MPLSGLHAPSVAVVMAKPVVVQYRLFNVVFLQYFVFPNVMVDQRHFHLERLPVFPYSSLSVHFIESNPEVQYSVRGEILVP
ncbi:hypothetical protein D3C74_463010 [compost metagenome]